MNIRDTVEAIRATPSCRVLPSSSMPIANGAIIPEDLRVFYGICGGVELYRGRLYPITIVCPSAFLRSNKVILSEDILGDISHTGLSLQKMATIASQSTVMSHALVGVTTVIGTVTLCVVQARLLP